MRKRRTRIATIAIFSCAVFVGGVHTGHAKAESGIATPFGAALLGATLAVIGAGAATERSAARETARPGAIASRARPGRGATAGAQRARSAATSQNADLAQ